MGKKRIKVEDVRFKMIVEEEPTFYATDGDQLNFETAAKLFDHIRDEPVECMSVVFLNIRSRVLRRYIISRGHMTGTYLDLRELFRAVCLTGATRFILAHNHPSGVLLPSNSDLALTKQVIEAGVLMYTPLIDHFIVGPTGTVDHGHYCPDKTFVSLRKSAALFGLHFKDNSDNYLETT